MDEDPREGWSEVLEEERGYSDLGHSPLNATERFRYCTEVLSAYEVRPSHILDVGGSTATSLWLSERFPSSTVTVLNSDPLEGEGLSGAINVVRGDAQDFRLGSRVDLIFAGELIEHLWNPDGLIESCTGALAPGGWLVITTPNLACLANRLFLALGWTPGNISPSIRYIVGNPVLPTGSGEVGTIAFHKSVFTLRGLVELLGLYGFELIEMRGYSYAPPPGQLRRGLGGRAIASSGYRIRRLLNRVTPHRLREGMILFLRYRPSQRRAPPLEVASDVPNLSPHQ